MSRPIEQSGTQERRIAAERNRRDAVEAVLTDIRFARYVSGYREGMDAIALDFIEALERRGYTVAKTPAVTNWAWGLFVLFILTLAVGLNDCDSQIARGWVFGDGIVTGLVAMAFILERKENK